LFDRPANITNPSHATPRQVTRTELNCCTEKCLQPQQCSTCTAVRSSTLHTARPSRLAGEWLFRLPP